MNNVYDKNTINQCTGCGICSAVCPVNAIVIELNEEGFYNPKIDLDICISCGKCKTNCYKFDDKIIKTGQNITSFSAINKDTNLLNKCSSGAVSEEIMKECIKRGYKVIGVEYDYEKNNAKSTICGNIEELKKYRGSKYFQSYTVDALKKVVIDKENKYAIFGTPCQIYAVKKFMIKNNLNNHILIDCFCHGVPTMHLWKSYIANYNLPFRNINFRTKDYGWHNYSFNMVDNKLNSVISPRNNDRFYDLFFSKHCFNLACYDCQLRSTVAYADIRLGDFWGNRYKENRSGVSAIVAITETGKNIIESLVDKLEIEKVDFNEVIYAQSYGKMRSFDKSRDMILKCLMNNDIENAYAYYKKSLNLKSRFIKQIKNIIRLCPSPVEMWFRKLSK